MSKKAHIRVFIPHGPLWHSSVCFCRDNSTESNYWIVHSDIAATVYETCKLTLFDK